MSRSSLVECVQVWSEPMLALSRQEYCAALLNLQRDAYLLALRILCDEGAAEDAVQDAYLRAVKVGALPEAAQLRKWFLRVVANAAKDRRLRERRRRTHERNASMPQNSSREAASAAIDSQEFRNALTAALRNLDDDLRLPVSLHFEQGLPYAEAAEILEMNEGTLRVYAQRGLSLLRQTLQRQGYTAAPAVLTAMLSQSQLSAPATLSSAIATILSTGALPAGKAAAAGGVAAAGLATKIGVTAVLAVISAALVFTFNSGSEQPAAEQPPPTAGAKAPDRSSEPKRKFIYSDIDLQMLARELDDKFGVQCAFPPMLRNLPVTVPAGEYTLKEISARIAERAGLVIEQRAGVLIFWRTADDKLITELAQRLEKGDVQARCEAVWELARLSDPRIYPLLFKMLNDPDPAVQHWLGHSLYSHSATLGFGTGIKEFVQAVRKSSLRAQAKELFLISSRQAEVISEILQQYKLKPTPDSAMRLAEIRAEAAIPILVEQAEDPQLRERLWLTSTLGLTRSCKATRPLLAALKASRSQAQAATAALSLSQIKDPAAVPDLIAMLKSENALIREGAVRAFSKFGDERALEALIEAAKDPVLDVRTSAVIALSQHADARAVAAVAQALEASDLNLRSCAAEALTRIDHPKAAEVLMDRAFDQGPASDAAFGALYYLQQPVPRSAIERLLKKDERAKQLAIILLARSADDDAARRLLEFAQDADATTRRTALRSLLERNDPGVPELLFKALGDKELRLFALEALAKGNDPRAAEALVESVKSAKPMENWQLRTIAGILGEKLAPSLSAALEKSSGQARRNLTQVLSSLDIPSTAPLLARLLKDPDAETRRSAAMRLSDFGPVMLPLLLPLLDEPNAQLRDAVVQALSSLSDPRAAEPLVARLRKTPAIGFALDAYLASLSDPDAHKRRLELASDSHPQLRDLGLRALAGNGSEESIAFLLQQAQDKNAATRAAALTALCTAKDARATAAVGETLKTADKALRANLAGWLTASTSAEGAVLLLGLTKDPEAAVRTRALVALLCLQPHQPGADKLRHLLKDSDAAVRYELALRMHQPEWIELGIELLQDSQARVRRAAAIAMVRAMGLNAEQRKQVEAAIAVYEKAHPGEMQQLETPPAPKSPAPAREDF